MSQHCLIYIWYPLQNETLGILIIDGGKVLQQQKTGPPKSKHKVFCRGLQGTEVVNSVTYMTPSGHRAVPHQMYAFHPHEPVGGDCLIP
jgi:hypothetical protein